MEGLNDDIRRVMARNEEILECRRQVQHWSDRLTTLEAELRRDYLRGSFEYDPQGTWDALTEEERQEKDFVIKALSCTPCVFGHDPCPWSERVFAGGDDDDDDDDVEQLPEQFREDRDAVLTFMNRDDFSRSSPFNPFKVPESLRDDKEVIMTLACRRSSGFLPRSLGRSSWVVSQASPRLKNDFDVAFAVIAVGSNSSFYDLQHLSSSLKKNKNFILAALSQAQLDHGNEHARFTWIFQYSELTIEDEKQVALAILERLKESQTKVKTSFLREVAGELRDDVDFMLQFIQYDGRALQFCSDRLKSCKDLVKVAIMNCPTPGGLQPETEVILKLTVGQMLFEELSPEMRMNRSIILGAAAVLDKPFFHLLSDHLQSDENLCLEMITAGYCAHDVILKAVPSLYSSRDAILAVIKNSSDWDPLYVEVVIKRCDFQDDREVMLSACGVSGNCGFDASERLRSDRDFVYEAMTRSQDSICIEWTSDQFQCDNVDLVVKAIELCGGRRDCRSPHDDGLTADLAADIWVDRSVVMACLKKGWQVLDKLDPESPLLEDMELVRSAVQNAHTELQYASPSLKRDRDFILSLVSNKGRSLQFADDIFKNDDEVLTAAVADTSGAIVGCFRTGSNTDFERVALFASGIRSKLELFDTFVVEFLRGISIVRQHEPPMRRCHLPKLDRGVETSIAFKKLIAQFVGVPLVAELQQLRAISVNLRKLGF